MKTTALHWMQTFSIGLSIATLILVVHVLLHSKQSPSSQRLVGPTHHRPSLHRWHHAGHAPTNSSTFTKIGMLTKDTAEEPALVLPLFGKRSPTRRHRWMYHTVNDTYRSISGVQLPVSYQNRDCTEELACDEVYSGDTVYVHGYSEGFTVSIYGH